MHEEGTPSLESRLNVVVPLVFGALFIGVLVLIPMGHLAWQFSGGWDGIRPQVEPSSPTVVAAREEADAALPAQQAELDALITPITGEPRARGTANGCTRGHNNWKIHDGYTLSCATAAIAIYPWPSDHAPFTELTTTLTEHGYQPAGKHTALDNPHHTGTADGRYTSDNTELHLQISPPGRTLPSIIHPRDDAYSDKNTDDINTLLIRPEHTILIVVHTRTYFED